MRKQVCDEITRNHERYCVVPNYVKDHKMETLSTWGTETEIAAAATMLKTNVEVCMDGYKGGVSWLKFEPHGRQKITATIYIRLTHDHYSPVLSF